METRQRRRPANPQESKSGKGYQAAAQVVYTDAKTFNKKRLFWRLGGIVAVVLALVFGMSIFFKVDKITVTGVDGHMQYAVYEACGIREGDNLLGISKAKVSGRILQSLPYVDSVQIRINLPDTVNIEVKAVDITYVVEDTAGMLWLISASGKVVEACDETKAKDYTRITGVLLNFPQVGKTAVAYEAPPQGTEDADASAVLASDRLNAALSIAKTAQEIGMLEGIDSIDVTSLSDLKMYYDDRLEILFGDNQNLSEKVATAQSAIAQLNDLDKGILDISYRIRPDDVIFTRETTES